MYSPYYRCSLRHKTWVISVTTKSKIFYIGLRSQIINSGYKEEETLTKYLQTENLMDIRYLFNIKNQFHLPKDFIRKNLKDRLMDSLNAKVVKDVKDYSKNPIGNIDQIYAFDETKNNDLVDFENIRKEREIAINKLNDAKEEERKFALLGSEANGITEKESIKSQLDRAYPLEPVKADENAAEIILENHRKEYFKNNLDQMNPVKMDIEHVKLPKIEKNNDHIEQSVIDLVGTSLESSEPKKNSYKENKHEHQEAPKPIKDYSVENRQPKPILNVQPRQIKNLKKKYQVPIKKKSDDLLSKCKMNSKCSSINNIDNIMKVSEKCNLPHDEIMHHINNLSEKKCLNKIKMMLSKCRGYSLKIEGYKEVMSYLIKNSVSAYKHHHYHHHKKHLPYKINQRSH